MRIAVALTMLAVAAPASAAKWAVVAPQSRIGWTATWLGKPVEGSFTKFQAAIDFDPAVLAASKIAVTIDLGSAASGDRTVDGALPGDDWFAVKTARTATFVASKVTAAGPGRYIAAGSLTIRGTSVPVSLPFALAIAGDTAIMTGRVQLDRRMWKLGLESDAKAEYVAFAVPVTIKIAAKRIK